MAVDFIGGDYFGGPRVKPAVGRLITHEDEAAGRGNTTLVLRYDVWRNQFHADSGIVGTSVRLNGVAFSVVGVANPGFGGRHSKARSLAATITLGCGLKAPLRTRL